MLKYRGLLPAEHAQQGGFGRLLFVTQQVRVKHCPVKGHKACVTGDRQMQRRDVAVPCKRLGMAAQELKIDAVKQARATIATAQAENRINAVVRKCVMQITQANCV